MNYFWIALDVAMVVLLLKASGLTWFTGIQLAELFEIIPAIMYPDWRHWSMILMGNTVLLLISVFCTTQYRFVRLGMLIEFFLRCAIYNVDADWQINRTLLNIDTQLNRAIGVALLVTAALMIYRKGNHATKAKAAKAKAANRSTVEASTAATA